MEVIRKSLNGSRITKERHHISTPTPLPSLSKPSTGVQPPKKVIRALESYKSQAPQELSYEKGDFFHVVADGMDESWYEAHNPMTGARGFVARVNFEEFSKGAPTPRSPNLTSPLDRMSSIVSAKSTSPKSPTFKAYYAIVLHDFAAERADELDAKSGDAIKVVAQSNREWFVAQPIGRLGRPGLIPVSYVEMHDPSTGKVIPDVLPLIESGDVPRVEEWKKSVLNFKANSISLGVLDDSPNQTTTTTRTPSPPAGPTITLQGATPLPGEVKSSQVSPTPPSPRLLPEGILLSAEIKSYHYEAEEYWFRVHAIYQPYNAGRSSAPSLPLAKELVLFRCYNDFYDFQVELLDTFPYEAGRPDTSTRILPYMPGPVDVVDNDITMSRRDELDEYLRKLCALKSYARYILEHSLIRSFCSLKPGDGEVNVEPRRGEIEALQQSHDQDRRSHPDPTTTADQMARLRVSQHRDNRLSDASRYEDEEGETANQPSKYHVSHKRTQSSNSQRHPARTHSPGVASQSYSRTHSPAPGFRSRSPLEIDPHEANTASRSSLSSSHDPSPVSMRSSQAGSVHTPATSVSGRSRSVSNAAYNPPISATNSATAFVKIKIFDRVSDDLVAIRVHPKVTHAQLVDKVQARLGSDVLALRYRDSLSNELVPLENDMHFRQWLDSTDRHVLYAE